MSLYKFWLAYCEGKPRFTQRFADREAAEIHARKAATDHPGVEFIILESKQAYFLPPASVEMRMLVETAPVADETPPSVRRTKKSDSVLPSESVSAADDRSGEEF